MTHDTNSHIEMTSDIAHCLTWELVQSPEHEVQIYAAMKVDVSYGGQSAVLYRKATVHPRLVFILFRRRQKRLRLMQ